MENKLFVDTVLERLKIIKFREDESRKQIIEYKSHRIDFLKEGLIFANHISRTNLHLITHMHSNTLVLF